MKTYLKIKIKSLASEAVIIKQEERKWWKLTGTKEIFNNHSNVKRVKEFFRKDHPLILGLREHRIHVVRTECRSSNIAYGYLRGRAYKQIENKCYEQPNWERIAEIIRSFSGRTYVAAETRKQLADDLKAWSEASQVQKAA